MSQEGLSQSTVLSDSVLRDGEGGLFPRTAAAATANFNPKVFVFPPPLTVEDVTGEGIEEFSPSPPRSAPSPTKAPCSAHAKKGIPRPVIITRRNNGEQFVVETMKAAAVLLNTSPSTIAKVLDGKLYVHFWYSGGYVTVSAARRRGDGLVPLVLVPAKVSEAPRRAEGAHRAK